MARPSVTHNGFLIPNAQDVSNTLLAEPDKIDFNTVANARWGVVSGCALGEQGAFALTVGAGVAVVNGEMVRVRGGTVTLSQPPPGGGARFINIVVDKSGNIQTRNGDATADPVYKDIALDDTLLATAYAASDATSLQDFVIDKRHFLTPALLANVGPAADLVRNYNSPTPSPGDPVDWFRINGKGDIFWAGDEVTLKRKDATALTLNKRLEAEGLQAQNNIVTTNGNIQATLGIAIARNLRNAPADPAKPLNPGLGDLWQDTTNGVVYVGTRIGVESGEIDWQPLATGDTALPVGTIIDSVEDIEVMRLKGWLALNGTPVSEDDYENLFKLASMAPWISGGTAPHRTMTLPNLDRRFRITDFDDTAREGGSNYKTLTPGQLPTHHHGVTVDPHGDIQPTANLSGISGAHTHPISGDGKHDHDVYDKGHQHGANFINTNVNGGAMLDGVINDRSHTYRVQHNATTAYGYSNIVANPSAIGGLSIPSSGTHNHTVQVSAISGMYHVVRQNAIGNNESIDITPAYFTVRSFIRS